MHINSFDSNVHSYGLQDCAPARRLHPPISLPVYRSWSPHTRRRSSSVGRTMQISLDSKAAVHKLVLDVRRTLHKHRSPAKQSHTNEVDGHACSLCFNDDLLLFV